MQRQLSKKQKGGKNRDEARLAVSKHHEKITNRRQDSLHQLSRKLIDENQVIVVEDLAVANLMKNHKLAKSIANASWGELLRQLSYKAEWYGRTLIQIGRFFPSSKTCFDCQFIKQDLTLKDRTWTCSNCGKEHDRDLNAAKNILKQGLNELTNLGLRNEVLHQKLGEAFSAGSEVPKKNLGVKKSRRAKKLTHV